MATNLDQAHFDRAIERFDAAHAEDPEREISGGVPHPKELLYATRMSGCLASLAPDASIPLKLAVRCQHIRRWSIPRDSYPMDVEGYRKWRADESKAHAESAGRILGEVGYDVATIQRVQALVRKDRLRHDPEAQLLEDVACIVFLDSYFDEFSQKHDEETLVRILRKTWQKMSARGQQVALGLALPPRLRALVDKALVQA